MRIPFLASPSVFFVLLSFLFLAPPRPQAQISARDLNDFRVYLDFQPSSGYYGNASRQDEMRAGLTLMFKMWQSVLPDLHFRWVYAPEDANFTMHFANYTTYASRLPV